MDACVGDHPIQVTPLRAWTTTRRLATAWRTVVAPGGDHHQRHTRRFLAAEPFGKRQSSRLSDAVGL